MTCRTFRVWLLMSLAAVLPAALNAQSAQVARPIATQSTGPANALAITTGLRLASGSLSEDVQFHDVTPTAPCKGHLCREWIYTPSLKWPTRPGASRYLVQQFDSTGWKVVATTQATSITLPQIIKAEVPPPPAVNQHTQMSHMGGPGAPEKAPDPIKMRVVAIKDTTVFQAHMNGTTMVQTPTTTVLQDTSNIVQYVLRIDH